MNKNQDKTMKQNTSTSEKNNNPQTISPNVDDLVRRLQNLNSKERMLLCEARKEDIASAILASSLIHNATIVETVLNCMRHIFQFSINYFEALQPEPPEQKNVFFLEGIELTKLASNLESIIKELPSGAADSIYQCVKNQLPAEFNLEKLVKPPQLTEKTTTFKKRLNSDNEVKDKNVESKSWP